VRLASPFLIVLLPVFVIQVLRYRSEVDTAHPRLWITVTLFTVVFGCGLYLARGDWRTSLR
jgi:hypothetical protein